MSQAIESRDKALFCVTGLTPQIVTETLYGLCVQQEHAWIPDRVLVLTTAQGKQRILEQLLNPLGGWFAAFCSDYGLVGRIAFDASDVLVPINSAGLPLDDVRSEADNVCMGDAIASTIYGLTQQYDAVHVSIAGGRKTMGYYAGSALSLYGRAQDRMSHVLVNEPFEQAPNFYFPPASPVPVVLRDGVSTLSSSLAQVSLAEMPFLRLGSLTAPSLQAQPVSFAQLVAQAQSAVRPVWLSVDIERYTVCTGAGEVRLEPSVFTAYVWFVMIKKRNIRVDGRLLDSDSVYASHYVHFAHVLSPKGGLIQASAKRLAQDVDGPAFTGFLEQKLSNMRRAFKTSLHASAAALYDVQALRLKGRALVLDAAHIELPNALLRFDFSHVCAARSARPSRPQLGV